MDVEALAREAAEQIADRFSLGFCDGVMVADFAGVMERFAALVLEEAAKACEERADMPRPTEMGDLEAAKWLDRRAADAACAAAIRALKQDLENGQDEP